ncbi:MAG: hypothetical protein ACOX2A_09740 [Tepidanaerobacteraceae bacterium]|jgi:hypothetical protein|nr:hypothetical protein [Thermoanaerobacterales bacterium]
MAVTIIRKILAVAFGICLIFSAVPGKALGEPGYTIVGDDNGLEIHVPKKTQDTGNLNPGDKKYSSLKLVNTGSRPLHVYIRTNILSERAPRGGRLSEVMTLVIKDKDNVITDHSFKDAAREGNVYIGRMSPGAEKILDFYTDLPEEIGNDYQASSMRVNWTFTTQSDKDDDDDDDDDDHDDDRDDDDDSDRDHDVEIDDEEIPKGPGEPEIPSEPGVEITIDDDEVPLGPADMPGTGEVSPLYYYGAGALIVTLGVVMKKK